MSTDRDDFIEIGRILKPFGIKGELKVRFYIDDVSDLKEKTVFYVKDKKQLSGFRMLTVSSIKFEENPENARVLFNEIVDRTSAETWRLIPIFVKAEILSPPSVGEYFIKDLLELDVYYNQEKIGTVFNIINVGSQDIFVLKMINAKQDLAVPFTEEYVSSISIEEQKIFFQNLDQLL